MKLGPNHTMVVCEEGTLLLQADGKITIFRKGKVVDNEPLPKVAPRDHWKDWADNCLGAKKPLWTPFQIGWRITEPALLAVKATRYPGEELRWDSANCRFTNHDKANPKYSPAPTAPASSLRRWREGPTGGSSRSTLPPLPMRAWKNAARALL